MRNKFSTPEMNKTGTRSMVRKGLQTSIALVFLFSLILPVFSNAQASGDPLSPNASWNLSTVLDAAEFYEMMDRSMRIDSNGNPNVAFGGDHLYFSKWDATNKKWITRMVDSSPQVGSFASLALDKFNNPRIAYYDEMNGSLKFAYSQDQGANWVSMTIDTPSNATADPIIDPYRVEDVLRNRMQANPEFWQNTPGIANDLLANSSTVGTYTSIVVDSASQVHISYYAQYLRSLKYARWDGLTWHYDVVDSLPPNQSGYEVGKFTSIAVDSNNLPGISYLDERHDGLRYAYYNGAGWNIEEIDSLALGEGVGAFSSLAFDSSNIPHISYLDYSTYRLKYATYVREGGNCGDSGAWACQTADGNEGSGWYTSIALRGSEVVISYFDEVNGDLRLANKPKNKSWGVRVLEADGYVGQYTSLGIASDGTAMISFYKASTGEYLLERISGNSATISLIAQAAKINSRTSLAISSFNIPFISFFNDIGDQLLLANGVGTSWFFTGAVGNASGYTSVKINAAGNPRIAYYDIPNEELVLAYREAGKWYRLTVDTTGNVGTYPSLVLDAEGRPHISYYDTTNKSLKFAYSTKVNFWESGSWVIEFVDTSVDVGTFNSLTLSKDLSSCYAAPPPGMSSCPMISYYDAANQNLKFAFKTIIGVWASQVVDSTGEVGQYSSMALDNSGKLHIAYYDAGNTQLKDVTGTKDVSQWVWAAPGVVDNGADVGQYSSLAIDALNQMHVSYYDATNGDLKYALNTGGGWTPEVVDSQWNVGLDTSLALFPNGQPAISYFDGTNNTIKFATGFAPPFGHRYYLPLLRKLANP